MYAIPIRTSCAPVPLCATGALSAGADAIWGVAAGTASATDAGTLRLGSDEPGTAAVHAPVTSKLSISAMIRTRDWCSIVVCVVVMAGLLRLPLDTQVWNCRDRPVPASSRSGRPY